MANAARKIRVVNDGSVPLPSLMFAGMPVGLIVADTTGQNWQLVQSTAPADHTSVEACAGNPNLRWVVNASASGYLASNYGVSPSNADNTAAWNALVATIRASSRGGRIYLEPGPYDFKSATTDPGGSPIEVCGAGPGLTYLRTATGLLASGNLFTPGRYWHMYDLTLGSSAQRSGGAYVRVVGDMLIADVPSILQGYEFGNVTMQDGYEGVQLVDGAGSKGVCGFFWDGMYGHVRGFAPGGCPFVINSPNGVVNKIQNVIHSETSTALEAARPRATVHMTGAADFRLTAVENVYCVRGWIIDPGAGGRVATVFATDCIWGQTTQEAVYITPNATADIHTIQMTGGYVDTGGMYIGAATQSIYVGSMSFFGNTLRDAIRYDGASGGTFENLMFSGNNSNRCFYASSNAKNFRVTGAFRNKAAVNNVGVRIDAGCDKYKVDMVGGEYCTTPLTAPANDATKSASIF